MLRSLSSSDLPPPPPPPSIPVATAHTTTTKRKPPPLPANRIDSKRPPSPVYGPLSPHPSPPSSPTTCGGVGVGVSVSVRVMVGTTTPTTPSSNTQLRTFTPSTSTTTATTIPTPISLANEVDTNQSTRVGSSHETREATSDRSNHPPPSHTVGQTKVGTPRLPLPPPISNRSSISPTPPAAVSSVSSSSSSPPPASSAVTRRSSESNIIDFDLFDSLALIQADAAGLTSRLEFEENQLLTTRNEMIAISRRNFVLERELHEIDEKIKLLIKNRLTIQEVMTSAASHTQMVSDEPTALAVLKNRKALYEELFFLLQSTPRYFALLARLIQPSKDSIATFVQTVVIDVFADAFDPHEERLLLQLFRHALASEITSCTDRSTLFRSNTALTQMLSAYAKRGEGLSMLRFILEEPLRELCDTFEGRKVNLELQPLKIYQSLIQDYEVQTGEISKLSKQVQTDEEALLVPEVRELIQQRVEQLMGWCERILKRIVENAKKIPYGMRSICRMLGELYRARFGGESGCDESTLTHQIHALQGGFIYLRFLNPMIVAPESMNLIATPKPSRIQRRNLILIAKVLQNLSNHVVFGEKEGYMKVMNDWIRKQFEMMKKFFGDLTNIDEIEDESLMIERYTYSSLNESSSTVKSITLSCKQIFFLHNLLLEYRTKICLGGSDGNGTYSSQDPLAIVLSKLSNIAPPPPTQVAREENGLITLRLIDTRKERLSTTIGPMQQTASASSSSSSSSSSTGFILHSGPGGVPSHTTTHAHNNPLYLQAKTLLLNVLKRITPPSIPPQRQSLTASPPSSPSSSASASASSSSHVDDSIPPPPPPPTLLNFLLGQRQVALSSGNHSLHDALNNVSSMLSTLFNMRLLVPPPSPPPPSTSSSADHNSGVVSVGSVGTGVGVGVVSVSPPPFFFRSLGAPTEKERSIDAFLYTCTRDLEMRRLKLESLSKMKEKIDTALVTVTKHEEYLKSRLEIYQIYLANVKQGQALQKGGGGGGGEKPGLLRGASFLASASASFASSYKSTRTLKFSHADLVNMHLIHSLDGDYSDKILKHLQYRIEMMHHHHHHHPHPTSSSSSSSSSTPTPPLRSDFGTPRFFISVHLKKGLSIALLPKPVEIVFEELLHLQEHGQPYFTVDAVQLNVNVLVHFLNTQFIAHIKP